MGSRTKKVEQGSILWNCYGSCRGAVTLFVLVSILVVVPRSGAQSNPLETGAKADSLPSVRFQEVPALKMPGIKRPDGSYVVDSNSPVQWDGSTMYMFNSDDHPWRFSGPNLLRMGNPLSTSLGWPNDRLSIWIESTWRDEDGTLYAWYHYEPDDVCRSNAHLPTAPRIGALRSSDNGATWKDIGFVLEAPLDSLRCNTGSPWDAGGEGDFSVILDREKQYFYFFFSSYVRQFPEQGVGVARMRYEDRANPSGRVWKWHRGQWGEPGLGGHFTPIFPARTNWHQKNADIFWGPAIHWNKYLNTFVIVLNHAMDAAMTQEGIYITFNSHLAGPKGWTTPRKILSRDEIKKFMTGVRGDPVIVGNGWYPEIIGTDKGETDKLVGRTGRFFMGGFSRLEIVFQQAGEKTE
jgi:hypothetical protein